jgi:hypothetical protein
VYRRTEYELVIPPSSLLSRQLASPALFSSEAVLSESTCTKNLKMCRNWQELAEFTKTLGGLNIQRPLSRKTGD